MPYYAILRAIPNKLLGVIAMFGSIVVLFLVPWLDTSRVRSARFRPVYRFAFWFLVVAWLVLAYCGAKPPEGAYLTMARLAALFYFAHFLILLPPIGVLETPHPLPSSIAEPVPKKALSHSWMSRQQSNRNRNAQSVSTRWRSTSPE